MVLQGVSGDQKVYGATQVASFDSFDPLRSFSPRPAITSATKNAMAAQNFMPAPQPRTAVTSHPPFANILSSINPFEREASQTVGTPLPGATPSPTSTVMIRRLPPGTTDEKLRLMTIIWSKEILNHQLLAPDQSDENGSSSAIIQLKSSQAALEVKSRLHGMSNMVVEIVEGSPRALLRNPIDGTALDAAVSPGASIASSVNSATSSRQPSRFSFQPFENLSPPVSGYSSTELAASEPTSQFQCPFSPHSPIGSHLPDRHRVSTKTLINEGADDEDTGRLLSDPLAYAEHGALAMNQRRSTAPAIPGSRLSALTLNTGSSSSVNSVSYGHMVGPLSAHGNAISPVRGVGSNMHFRAQHYPPANPADQNPPCNTLYVGNLPIDTSEEELKALFSKQRGYKRLCFRTKQNGPMCFVEFEDVSAATKALHDLYGAPLHNSIKGGIRLSFSKNPLGVRSQQNPASSGAGPMTGSNSMLAGTSSVYTTVNGPPPGLPGPPGMNFNRLGGLGTSSGLGAGNHFAAPFSGSGTNMWSMTYSSPMAAGGPSSIFGAPYPPHMMGK